MSPDAQTDLDRITAEERELVLPHFDLADAWALGSRMRDVALAAGHPIVIAIVMGDARVFHTALPGTSANNDAWLDRKIRVVKRYGRSSYGVGTSFRADGKDFDTSSRLDPGEYAAHGGAFPITIDRVGVVGVVAVSGLPQADDHAFVVAQLRAWIADLA